MSNTVHKKILPEYFDLVKKGIKKFELRKDEDDIVLLDFIKERRKGWIKQY